MRELISRYGANRGQIPPVDTREHHMANKIWRRTGQHIEKIIRRETIVGILNKSYDERKDYNEKIINDGRKPYPWYNMGN